MKVRLPLVTLVVLEGLSLAQSVELRALEKTDADYSQEARIAGLEGTVRLTAKIDQDGRPYDFHVSESLGLGLDEHAIEAVRNERFDPSDAVIAMDVRFLMPSKQSRWHLIRAEFQPGEEASRPEFLSAGYPLGAGIAGGAAIDQGRLVGAMGRQATVTLSFEVNDAGVPVHFRVENASVDVWGSQAIALVSEWRFKPGFKDGRPVAVPCMLELAWGPRELSAEMISRVRRAVESPASAPVKSDSSELLNVLVRVDPTYTQEALDAGLTGRVVVSLVMNEDGTPGDLRVVQGLGMGLDEKALEALRQWRFQPVYVNGQRSPLNVTLAVEFKPKPSPPAPR